MTAHAATERGASLRIFMDELGTLEQQVNVAAVTAGLPELTLYRWRRASIAAPALYHLIGGADTTIPDLARIRDTLTLHTRIAVAFGDDGLETDFLLEQYIDIYRDVTDPQLHETSQPLNGAASLVDRSGFRTLLDEFGGVPYLAVEFVYSVKLNRFVVAT